MNQFAMILPEILIGLTLVGIILAEIAYHGERVRLISWTALGGLGCAFFQLLIGQHQKVGKIFEKVILIDGISYFLKLFFVVLAALVVLVVHYTSEILEKRKTEFYAFVLAGALGMGIAVSSADMLLIFLSLQFMNFMGYFLAAYSERNLLSTEAGGKYLIFSIVSGAMFLYAVALLFAFTHSLNIYEMHDYLMANPMPKSTGIVVFVMLFLSLSFYLGVFPMYLWVPDVLTGAPTPSSIFLGLGVPAAGVGVALRFLSVVFSQAVQPGDGMAVERSWAFLGGFEWTQMVGLVSGVTMMAGVLLAVRQSKIKRMLSGLVVSQMGFCLAGLVVLDSRGIAALLYNMIVGLFSLVGAYLALSLLMEKIGSDDLAEIKAKKCPPRPEFIGLLLFVACFVGFPPFPGFIGKFALIGAVVRDHWYGLAGICVFSSLIAIVCFARLAYSLLGGIREGTSRAPGISIAQRTLLYSLFFPVFFLAIFAERALRWVSESLRLVLW